MRINLSGSFDLTADLQNSFAFLTDPKKLSGCVAGLKEAKFLDDSTFETILTLRIGPVNGNFDAKCKIAQVPPDSITITINGSGTASSMNLVLSLKLSKKTEKATSVTWKADTEINGLVSGLGETILRELSNSKIQEIISALKMKVI